MSGTGTVPDLAELERLAQAAQLPWHAKDRGIGWSVHVSPEPINGDHWTPGCPDLMDDDVLGKGVFSRERAELIVAAVNALPDLIARLRRAEAALAAEIEHEPNHYDWFMPPAGETDDPEWLDAFEAKLRESLTDRFVHDMAQSVLPLIADHRRLLARAALDAQPR